MSGRTHSRALIWVALIVALLGNAFGSSGCYRRVVGVKGAAPGQYEVYEPSVREASLSDRRAEERARAKAEAEKAKAEAEKERQKEEEKK